MFIYPVLPDAGVAPLSQGYKRICKLYFATYDFFAINS